jgi:hypothetical protein
MVNPAANIIGGSNANWKNSVYAKGLIIGTPACHILLRPNPMAPNKIPSIIVLPDYKRNKYNH